MIGSQILNSDCLFCKIIMGEVHANIVEQTDYVLAFHDINPQAKIHILIIPKIHIESTIELNNNNINYISKMLLLANKISVNEGLASKGYRLVINTGNDGGQTVNHLHLHLLGGRKLIWPPG